MIRKLPTRVAFHNKKGGVGKSTLCRALAASLQLEGYRVLIVDGDAHQWSSADWFDSRTKELGRAAALMPRAGSRAAGVLHVLPVISPSLANTEGTWDYVFYDLPGREDEEARAVLLAVDLVLVPLRPSDDDIKPLGQTLDLIQKAGQVRGNVLPAYVLVNLLRLHTRAATAVRSLGATLPGGVQLMKTQIRSLEDWSTARRFGLCPIELNPDGQAAQDLISLRREFIKVSRSHA